MHSLVLLHHDLEWTEERLADELRGRGLTVRLVDIRGDDIDGIKRGDVVLNRVYASVANRDYPAVVKALALIECLSGAGVRCINGYRCCRADYDKYFAYRCMSEAGIATPESTLISNGPLPDMLRQIDSVASKYGYPVVLKRNTGGRSMDIVRLFGRAQIEQDVHRLIEKGWDSGYRGDWLLQVFLHSARSYDGRISTMSGQFVHSHRRELVPLGKGEAWLGSASHGSECRSHDPTPEEIALAMAAGVAIEADCNEVDLLWTETGTVIVECNPTPQYFSHFLPDQLDRFTDGLNRLIRSTYAKG